MDTFTVPDDSTDRMDLTIDDAASLYSLDTHFSDSDDDDIPVFSTAAAQSDDDPSVALVSRPPRLSHVCADTDPRRVLFVPELFENIAETLDFYDLLRCQSVCKAWRHALNVSQPLSRRSFLKQIHDQPFTPLTILPYIPADEVWWIKEMYRNALNEEEECKKDLCLVKTHFSVKPACVNPVFASLAVNDHTCLRADGGTATFIVTEPGHVQALLDLHRRSDPQALWKSMFLTNPPVKTFKSFSYIKGDRVEAEEGVTMGEAVQHLVDILEGEEKKMLSARPVVIDLWAGRKARIAAWIG